MYQGARKARKYMQEFGYLVAAYAIVWVGLFIFLAVLMLRIRGVRTELAAVEQLVREQQEKQS
jgi:CcmD family protein